MPDRKACCKSAACYNPFHCRNKPVLPSTLIRSSRNFSNWAMSMILSSTGLVQSIVKVVEVLLLTPLVARACLVLAPLLGAIATDPRPSPAPHRRRCQAGVEMHTEVCDKHRSPTRKRKCKQAATARAEAAVLQSTPYLGRDRAGRKSKACATEREFAPNCATAIWRRCDGVMENRHMKLLTVSLVDLDARHSLRRLRQDLAHIRCYSCDREGCSLQGCG